MIEIEAFERMTFRTFGSVDFCRIDNIGASIGHLLDALLIDTRSSHLNGPILGETIVTSVVQHLLSCADIDENFKLNTLCPGKIAHIKEFIEDNLADPLSLEVLAGETGLSSRHLCRLFQDETGLTPHRYILIRRVERAKQLIRAGHLSFADVAATVGFASQAHMSTTFRTIAGVSPSQYRTT